MLWVSADGLRVVDDKTKVISPFSPLLQLHTLIKKEELSKEVHVALAALKVEAAELQQLIMVVRPLYFWFSDLQKALFENVLRAPAGVEEE